MHFHCVLSCFVLSCSVYGVCDKPEAALHRMHEPVNQSEAAMLSVCVSDGLLTADVSAVSIAICHKTPAATVMYESCNCI